ncbi:EF-hand domain-containing protein [Nonomuraea guangzhouensis]|uniref:EF-hand domain-containing protein n=1 Tax=Nonomuraea guangzhouensis TaxID=1291555 RepID=A0ABW4GNF9_9ACTN|nr:EF-hand domain-containing protein [Nonomuraea guangzhouensis]
MSQELVEANIAGVFAVFDSDGDGHISESDFTARAGHLCAALAPEAGSPHHDALRSAFAAWWEQIRDDIDSDGDGRVSREEFVAAMLSGAGRDPRFLAVTDRATAAVFDAADSDGDGTISRAEFARFYHAVEIPDEAISIAFDKLDTDGDGTISRQELIEGTQALLTSSDPAEPGTWLVGKTPAH